MHDFKQAANCHEVFIQYVHALLLMLMEEEGGCIASGVIEIPGEVRPCFDVMSVQWKKCGIPASICEVGACWMYLALTPQIWVRMCLLAEDLLVLFVMKRLEVLPT